MEVGGFLMWILLAMSIISLGIILERVTFFIRNEKSHNKLFKSEIIMALAENNKDKAIELCRHEKNSIGISIKKFLLRCKNGKDFHHYEQLIKEIEIEEIGKLESRLHVLAIAGYIAPMIGLLGTVVGMIDAFTNLSKFGAGDPAIVADGISKALITTAAGLSIAIPSIVVYNLLNKKIESIEDEIDKIATSIIDIIRE
jgi:biopolymer transport protein ExbB